MEDVKKAIKSIQVTKSPSLDGFTTDFFHSCWDIINEEVWKIIKNSHQTEGILSDFNITFPTLIPKGSHPSPPDKFHPIDIYNVI